MADSDNESGGVYGGNANSDFSTKEQDRFLPIANVSRIMKKALPANAKISKDAKETVQECVSEFISFVTGEASDKCQREKRKTINGDDLLWAMTTLGFEDYVEPLKIYLQKYREMEGDKTSLGRHGEKEGGSSGGSGVVGFNGPEGMYGGMTIGHHQGHVYGSGGFNPGNGGGGGGSNMRSRCIVNLSSVEVQESCIFSLLPKMKSCAVNPVMDIRGRNMTKWQPALPPPCSLLSSPKPPQLLSHCHHYLLLSCHPIITAIVTSSSSTVAVVATLTTTISTSTIAFATTITSSSTTVAAIPQLLHPLAPPPPPLYQSLPIVASATSLLWLHPPPQPLTSDDSQQNSMTVIMSQRNDS